MKLLTELELQPWQPDWTASHGGGAEWIRLLVPGVGELSNHLEAARLEEPGAQWLICSQCGREGCGDGASVRVSRTASHLLFTAPRAGARGPQEVQRTHPLVLQHGALLLSLDRWAELVDRGARRELALPHETSFPEADGRDLWDLWVSPLSPLLRRLSPREFAAAYPRMLTAAERAALREELEALMALCDWFAGARLRGNGVGIVEAALLRLEPFAVPMANQPDRPWNGFARAQSGELYAALGDGSVLLSEATPVRRATVDPQKRTG